MKCGIMTFFGIPNYGAVLQAYSLCKVIREMGISCELINYVCNNIVKRELTPRKTSNIIKNTARYILWKKYSERRIKECSDFISDKKMIGSTVYTSDKLSEANDVYDVFISGSDMIWDDHITAGDLSYFLPFAEEEKPKIAYGSSDGNGLVNLESAKIEMLRKYDHIGVRESDSYHNLINHGIDCSLVADPTMLITAESWAEMCTCSLESKYVLVYFPSEVLLSAAKNYASKHNTEIWVIADHNKWGRKVKCVHIYSLYDWLSLIKNAEAVFTDSYHGVLFSMYFNKPFFTNNNGNRVSTLLTKFSLGERYIGNNPDYSAKIDYNKVNEEIYDFRAFSLNYLKNALKVQQNG